MPSRSPTRLLRKMWQGGAQLDKIALLKHAFQSHGTVTAANASSISDGAAAMLPCC